MSNEARIFSPPRSDAPWWVLPILTFVTGVAITAAVLMPSVSAPEYTRGHADGYKAGHDDANRDASNREQLAIYSGAIAGYQAAQRGEPLPVSRPE